MNNLSLGYSPTMPRLNDRPHFSWTANPTQFPRTYISLADVSNVRQESGSIVCDLGVAWTGETITTSAIVFNSPGMLSVPVPVGNIGSNNNFTPSNTPTNSGAQVLAFPCNDQWIVFATRDTRTQTLPGTLSAGETAIYCQVSPAVSLYKDDGTLTHQTTDASVTLTTNGQVCVGDPNLDTTKTLTYAEWSQTLLDGLTALCSAMTTDLGLSIFAPDTYTAAQTLLQLLQTGMPPLGTEKTRAT